jgi:YidC/Oxa1 family membrane protein insertase
MTRAQQFMPALSALGLLVAGGVVPVALLVYWVCNALWTLGQSAVVWRWFPTPGSPAATRRHATGP